MIRMTIIKAPETGTTSGRDMSGIDMVFGPGGGTIGRSRSSTWVLTDTECLVSRTHAEIYADNGQYFVTDKSTNGLFLNKARKPLGFGQVAQLRGGDQLHIGHYVIAVSIEAPPVAVDATDLGSADFLDAATADPMGIFSTSSSAQESESPLQQMFVSASADTIPDNWQHDDWQHDDWQKKVDTDDNFGTLCNPASWFENSLRMTLAPIVGKKSQTLPASDLITLIAQLARAAIITK